MSNFLLHSLPLLRCVKEAPKNSRFEQKFTGQGAGSIDGAILLQLMGLAGLRKREHAINLSLQFSGGHPLIDRFPGGAEVGGGTAQKPYTVQFLA